MLNSQNEFYSDESPPPSDNLPELSEQEIQDFIKYCETLFPPLENNETHLVNPEQLNFKELNSYLFCELNKVSGTLKAQHPDEEFYDKFIKASLAFIQKQNIDIYLNVCDKNLQNLEIDYFLLSDTFGDLITYLKSMDEFSKKESVINYLTQVFELTHAVSEKFSLDKFKKENPCRLKYINQTPAKTPLTRQSIFHKIGDLMRPSAVNCSESTKLKL